MMEGNATEAINKALAEPKKHTLFADLFLRMFREKPLGTIGFFIVAILLLVGIFANFIAPYPMAQVNLADKLLPPSTSHLLGTDALGEDELSNLIYGARYSLVIGLSATFLNIIIAVLVGGVSALLGKKFDLVMQRFVDAWLSIPTMLVLLIMMSIMGQGMWQIIIAIGIPMGIGGSRMIRSAVIAIKENTYVEAARAIGCSTAMIFRKHILPNIMPVIIVDFSVVLGAAILMEASLSFLGFGVPPGTPSWGSMLSQQGREYMEMMPSLALWPGFVLAIAVYGANMFGDAVRDLLDPRLKGGLGRYGRSTKRIKVRVHARS
jgi:peptide/nickel transport system permease protein